MQAILSTDARIKVFTAADALIGWAKLQKEAPDVVITDFEMPRMGSPLSEESWQKRRGQS